MGGTLSTGTGGLIIGNTAGSIGTVTLSGSRLSVARVYRKSTAATDTLNFNGGTLSPTAAAPAFVSGLSAAYLQAGGAVIDTAGFDTGISQTLLHDPALGATTDGGLTKAGIGVLTLGSANSYPGTTRIQGGTLRAFPAAYTHLLAGAGGVDLSGMRAKLVIEHTAGSPVVAQIRGLLAAGFDDNFASGQIRSTTAALARGLGYTDNGTTLTVMATIYGDADLDGGVSINDFNTLAANFGQASGRVWSGGDFDYDGGVSIDDFNLLAASFGQSLPASSPMWASLLEFAAAHNELAAFEAVTGVPEPTGLALLGGVSGWGLRRRQRSH